MHASTPPVKSLYNRALIARVLNLDPRTVSARIERLSVAPAFQVDGQLLYDEQALDRLKTHDEPDQIVAPLTKKQALAFLEDFERIIEAGLKEAVKPIKALRDELQGHRDTYAKWKLDRNPSYQREASFSKRFLDSWWHKRGIETASNCEADTEAYFLTLESPLRNAAKALTIRRHHTELGKAFHALLGDPFSGAGKGHFPHDHVLISSYEEACEAIKALNFNEEPSAVLLLTDSSKSDEKQ